MTNRATHADTAGEVGGIEQLQRRVHELEGQLRSASSGGPPDRKAHAGTKALKPTAAVLAATALLMALPAFITVRRWYWWWR